MRRARSARVVAGDVPVTIAEDTDYPFRDTRPAQGLAGQPGHLPVAAADPRLGEHGIGTGRTGTQSKRRAPASFPRIERRWSRRRRRRARACR